MYEDGWDEWPLVANAETTDDAQALRSVSGQHRALRTA